MAGEEEDGYHSVAMKLLIAASALLIRFAQAQPAALPIEPLRDAGQSVTGALEGWFKNPDGGYSILAGYYNRNLKEELDIPIGPANQIQPGGPDRGQPTHFLPGRGWGVFTIDVPADFGSQTLKWTLIAHGQTTEIPLSLNPLWEISPFREEGIGNTPPVLRFEPGGKSVQGPRPISISVTASVGQPLPLNIWASDDARVAQGAAAPKTPPVTVTWSELRGPGPVMFDNRKPEVEASGKAATNAYFGSPGEYVLLVVGNDWSGEGGRGFQCCWTNAQVKVSVK